MSSQSTLEEILRSLDPLTNQQQRLNSDRRHDLWDRVKELIPQRRASKRRRVLIGTGSFGVGLAALVTLAVVLIPTGIPLSAAAATLKAAATADSPAANLPVLQSGQYYYQSSVISQVCFFASPSMTSNITYIAYGTMQSWSNGSGGGKVAVTPSTIDGAGSHFATPQDQAEWIAAGKPFVPCALANASNELLGNAANANPNSAYPGGAFSFSSYGGFGFSLGPQYTYFSSSELNSATNINNLPSNPATIESMLANGEIGIDGTVSSTPQECPMGGPPGSTGCSTSQQVTVIQQLLSVPDASAKLGAVLYQVLSQMPGAKQVGAVTTVDGQNGTEIIIPNAQNEQFEVVLNPTTGSLLSCAELVAGAPAPVTQVTYGPISAVQGIGATS